MKTFLCALLATSLAAFAAAPPPDNDTFAGRISLVASGSISVQGRNASATSEAGEPTIDGEVVYKSVWWSWTAPFSGPTTVTTTGSSFDTLLGVFTGTSIATLASIAENDDAGGLYTSSVTFQAVGGVPYALLVGGVNNAGGKVKLSVNVAAGPCAYALSPSSRSVAYTAGSSTVGVTTTTGCVWSATSNDSWLMITVGSSGTGSGTVSYSIAANTALTSRTGTLTVAGLTHTVTQAAAPACTYSISPTAASVTASPVTNSFTMSAGTGCAWTATPNASWLTIQSGASGTGNGTTTYVVATNSLSNQRVGTITVAGLTHTVTQAGTVPCTYSISPTSAPFTSSGGTSNIVVSTLTACTWTASSPVSWVTFSTTNGTGNATVTYTVAANVSTVARSTTLTVAGNSFAVTQSGAPCTFALSPTSASVASGASTGTTAVTAGTGCAWTATANQTWLTITSGSSGSGNGTVGYSVGANPNTAIRVGTLTIGGQTFTVTQAAAPCSFSIAPTAAHYSDVTATGSIAVTAGTGCAWTAASNDAFITVNSGTPGSGSGTVGYTVAANVTTSSRTGTITVAGSTFTVTQDGTVPCSYGITPSSASYTSTGGSGSVAVTANAGCTWSASSAATWVTISTASGTGNGTVPYTVAANTSSIARTGTLTIAGNPFTVTQSGAPCVFAVSPTSSSFSRTGGSGTVAVTATAGCGWTSSSDSSWLTATNGASGTGNGTLIYSVASTTSPVTRTGRLTIAGKLLTVTQSGAPCNYTISPTGESFAAIGGSASMDLLTSDPACAWSASRNVSWITVMVPTNGNGNATVNYIVAPTSVTADRSGTITVGGQGFLVTQAGDTTAPVVTLTAPSNGSTVSNVINLTATATDDVGISRVDFYRDSAILIATDTSSPYSVPFSTTNAANGAHTFYALGFDLANNQGASATNSVTVSNAAPGSTNQWVKQFGGTGSDVGLTVAVDAAANVIVGGAYTGSVDFGGGVLTNGGFEDAFIASYNTSGTYSWARRFGAGGRDRVNGVAVDSSGNVFAAGFFTGTVDFGGGALTNAGALDIFLAKYNSAGAFQWSKAFGSPFDDVCYAVATDSSGSVFITGGFLGTINFGGTNMVNPGSYDFYVAKFNSAGTHVWSRRAVGNGQEFGMALAVDGNGDVAATGTFTAVFNPGSPASVTSAGGNDIFLVKYLGVDGGFSWLKNFGGATASDKGAGVAFDSNADVILTGSFSGSVSFDGTSPLATTAGYTDSFLAKYDGSAGSHVWSKRLTSGATTVFANGLALDVGNNAILTGYFQGTANFDGQLMGSGSAPAVFLSKYSTMAGAHTWTKSYGGAGGAAGSGVAVSPGGNPVATGNFAGTASFDGTSLTSAGLADVFLLKTNP